MRIVGGTAKGRRLAAPPPGTRPTSDRVREAMFNSLATTMEFDGARVLDLFAGTGAVGLEALSRGAATAVFVEKARPALAVLRRNVESLGLAGASIVASAVSAFVQTPPDDAFDLVFADPPYAVADAALHDVLSALARPGWLRAEGVVVVERSGRTPGPGVVADSLTPFAEKRYGDTLLWYGRAR